MDLHPRELAFLENEMEQIIEAENRRHSEKKHASTILGRVRGEIEWEASQNKNGSKHGQPSNKPIHQFPDSE